MSVRVLGLYLVTLAALPLQVEEVADLSPELEAAVLRELSEVISAHATLPVTVRDCRQGGCLPKDAASESETLHVLIFGGPTRTSITAERLGRGRALRASEFIPNDETNRRPHLERLARSLFPDSTARTMTAEPQLVPVRQVEVAEGDSGTSVITVASLIVAGVALAGAVTFGVMAHSSQSELSAKLAYDAEVPQLDDAINRDSTIAFGLLGVGLGGGIVAALSEALR